MDQRLVLYIEDNYHNRRLVRKILESRGYTVLEAEDGLKGLDMVRELRPPLVLMDIGLPGMDGLELTARIKGDEELRTIPVIALTASAMQGDKERFLAAGCEPAPDWSTRILDAHCEGFAACAGSIEPLGGPLARRALGRELAAWAPGFGRAPSWQLPLLCPSLLAELVPSATWVEPVAGLPALDPRPLGEPWICDGRIRVAARRRA